MRVLFIEDDLGTARLVQRHLERNGMTVEHAPDAATGAASARTRRFDAVLVDRWLLGHDGIGLLEELASGEVAPPVIMVTAGADVDSAIAAMKAGAADYIVKDGEGRFLAMLPSLVERTVERWRQLAAGQQAHALAHVTLKSIGDAVVTTDRNGGITSMNPVAERLTGWSAQEAAGRAVEEVLPIIDEIERGPVPNPVRRALGQGETVTLANHALLVTRGGDEVPIADSGAPIRDSVGRVLGAVLVLQDVTERRCYERNLRLFESIFQHTGEAIVITDAQARIVDLNEAFTRVTGYTRDEVLGRNPSMMHSGRHDTAFFAAMWQSITATGHWQGEIWDRRKNGEVYPKWASISAVVDGKGEVTHYVGVFSDITAMKRTEERLEQLAHFDALTGLPNRMLFHDRLRQALSLAERHGSRVGVMFLDLDRFKVINDSLGHHAGDELLVQVARRIVTYVRRSDTVARIGGDEFTVILGDIAASEQCEAVAQKIIDAFAAPFHVAGREVFTSTSIGISLSPDAGDTPEALTKTADIAMYRAKQLGRNNFQFYSEGADRLTHERLALETDMRCAVARSELTLHFQPQVDVASGQVVGVEALVRWQHPRRGLLAPMEFIPLAEECGLIAAIGEWVLEAAAHECRRWQGLGLGRLPVAVNVSGKQLVGGFVATVRGVLERTGLEPTLLELELTESTLMHNADHTAVILGELRTMGVRVAIDDFGTGYSSLSYLKRLPVDALKIDRTFMGDVVGRVDDAAISRGIIALARSLSLRVVAEGVEHGEQLDFLRSEGCHTFQGFHFSTPLAAEELSVLLRQCAAADTGSGTPT